MMKTAATLALASLATVSDAAPYTPKVVADLALGLLESPVTLPDRWTATVREDEYELYECEACGELQAAKIGEASRHTCRVTGATSVAVPVTEDPESDGDYDPSSGGWGSVVNFADNRSRSLESWEYDW